MTDDREGPLEEERAALEEQIAEFVRGFVKKDSIQSRVFALLKDRQWHCRGCEGKKLASGQYAGGGGIQGLQRGTKKRLGLDIETKAQDCTTCGGLQIWDRWTGEFKQANAPSNVPKTLIPRVLQTYDHTDVVEQRTRPAHELIVDHRFPMERWGEREPPNPADMPESEIRRKFQLLKKDGSGNHNLLKSRACEHCLRTGKRGEPLGIRFWYEGNENWPTGVPERGAEAENGCVGCGWYDFDRWRKELNRKLSEVGPQKV